MTTDVPVAPKKIATLTYSQTSLISTLWETGSHQTPPCFRMADQNRGSVVTKQLIGSVARGR